MRVGYCYYSVFFFGRCACFVVRVIFASYRLINGLRAGFRWLWEEGGSGSKLLCLLLWSARKKLFGWLID
jgi:hypothetical protein